MILSLVFLLLLSLRAACHRPLSSLLFNLSTLTPKPPCRSTQAFKELKLLNFLPPRLNSPRTAYRHQITSHISCGSSFLGLATDTFLYRSSRPRSAPRNSLAGFTTLLHESRVTLRDRTFIHCQYHAHTLTALDVRSV